MEVERVKKLQTVIDCPDKQYIGKFFPTFLERVKVNGALFLLGYDEDDAYGRIFEKEYTQKQVSLLITNRDLCVAKGFDQIFFCFDSHKYRFNVQAIALLQAFRRQEIPIIKLDPNDTNYPFTLHRTLQIKGVTKKRISSK